MKKLFVIIFLFVYSFSNAQLLKTARPESVGLSSVKLTYLDSVILKSINKKELPGAVVLIGRNNSIVYRKAFGNCSLIPSIEQMSTETIFDLASVTKAVATATSIMILVERGLINLNDNVKKYIPEFSSYTDSINGELPAEIFHLLTHTSGLPEYTNADSIAKKFGIPSPEGTIKTICNLKKVNPPGKKFSYSCLGYITLAEIVKRVTGITIAEFSKKEIFDPLKMKNTFYNPPTEKIKVIAPTEIINGEALRGIVHDPLARVQGGISGNAGLFSNVDDLAIFCQMMLNGGVYNNIRILGNQTIETMTHLYPSVEFSGRGLGWDINSEYMGERGEIFIKDCFGHTGFTGTSILINEKEKLFIILLTNRVHPDGKGYILPLRRQVANIVAGSIEK